ncbi:hypothetical protein Tco_0128412 [Tanacetum coccineum]
MYAGRMNVDGHVDIFDTIDIDLFSVVALNMMVVQLGYTGKLEPLFYNNLRPLTTLEEGLYALACEEDVRCLATLVRSFKATIEDITEPGSSAAIEHRSEKMLLLTWHDSSAPTKESVCDFVTPSQLLEAVGFDSIIEIFPLALCLVEAESRVHGDGRAKSDLLLNNICEIFNRNLVRVGQDGSGGSCVGAIIGLSTADGQGGAGGSCVGVGSQVPMTETKNADGKEMGNGIPTQSSAAGGASEYSFM